MIVPASLSTLPKIIQAPMAGSQGSALCIAVSLAGGLGSLPCAMLTPHDMRQELAVIHSALAPKGLPYNVNFFCHREPAHDEVRMEAWLERLKPYYQDLGLTLSDVPKGLGRLPFNEDAFTVLTEFKPRVVSFHFGLPDAKYVHAIQEWGGLVLSSATTLEEAQWLEQNGVNAVIAQGVEAGGHRGVFLGVDANDRFDTSSTAIQQQSSLWTLLPQVCQALRVPVIAAGGIARVADVRQALQLGASYVQIGTAYLLCPEAKTNPVHRAALLNAKTLQGEAAETSLTNLFTGRPARGLTNRFMREMGPLNANAPAFPLAGSALTPLRTITEKNGSGDFSPLWAGQNAKHCQAIPAAELTRQLLDA